MKRAVKLSIKKRRKFINKLVTSITKNVKKNIAPIPKATLILPPVPNIKNSEIHHSILKHSHSNIKPLLESHPNVQWFAQLSPIFIISIRERRWLDMKRILQPLQQHLVHWRGTDGRTINVEQWKRLGKIGGPRTYKRGQIGCYDSHRRIWQHIVDKKLSYALILEDDAGLTCQPAMLNKLSQVLDDVNKHDAHWELLYLARSRLRQPIVRKLTAHLAIPKYKSWGCFAYAVSQSGARKLLAHSQPMKHTLDAYVSMIGSRHLKTYTAHPSLFYVRSYKSDTANIV